MKNRFFPRLRKKVKSLAILSVQRLWISSELFSRNGLVNHAAGGAYGFLLSAAPALLILYFFINRALVAYPELATDLFRNIDFLSDTINITDTINNFLRFSGSGLAGLISVAAILWTVWICALSIRRGLAVIFPGSRFNPFRNAAVTFGLGILIILFIFSILLGSKLAHDFYNNPAFSFIRSLSFPKLIFPARIFHFVSLPLMILAVYRFVPVSPPKLKHIISGTLLCLVFFQIFSSAFALIINPDRYNLLYGTLGKLFLFMVNVYFFFTFFFFGAQMIMVLDSSEALFFIRFRTFHLRNPEQSHSGRSGRVKRILSISLKDKLYSAVPEPLEKYRQTYRMGETVFSRGSRGGQEAYYVISGRAGAYLDNEFKKRIAYIDAAHFFGEMESITLEERSVSIRAETDLVVLRLPVNLFLAVLRIDPETDQNIIKTLSERLKFIDNHMTQPSPRSGPRSSP